MEFLLGLGLGASLVTILIVILITIAIVAFWTWFITKIAIETHDRHRRKYPSLEMNFMDTQIRQNENLLTALLQIKSSTDQLNKTVEKLDNRIDNILLHKSSSQL